MSIVTGKYSFVIHDSFVSNDPLPLVVFLHGIAQRGDGTATGIQILQDFIDNPFINLIKNIDTGFILIAPQLPMGMSWSNDYVDAAIEYATASLPIKKDQIHLHGTSLGGDGALKYLSTPGNGAKLATATAICPAWGTWNHEVIAKSGCPLSFYHAQDDQTCPVSITNDAVTAINYFKPAIPPHKTIYPTGGHDIWGLAWDDAALWQWMKLNTNLIHKPVSTTTLPMATLTANAGPDQTIQGTTATLDGSASTGYQQAWWTLQSFNGRWDAGNYFETSGYGTKVNLKNLKPGEYLYKITVSDGVNKAEDTVKLTVQAATPTPVPTTRQLLAMVKVYLDNGKLVFENV